MLPNPSRIATAIFATAALAVGTAFAAPQPSQVALQEKPQLVPYSGHILDQAGEPLNGQHEIRLRYVDSDGATLLTETFNKVEIRDGHFVVALGAGKVTATDKYDSLSAVFADFPSLEFEAQINGVVQQPLVGVLPAGHSIKSRLVASGVDDDGGAHWKHYEAKGGATSLQAGTLAPAGSGELQASTPTRRVRPYLLPMRGPGLSIPVRDLPQAVQQKVQADGKAINPPRHEDLFDADGNRFGTTAPKVDDRLADVPVSATRTPSLNFQFEGVGNVSGVLPPDTEGTVGPNHYVHVVNSAFAIFDKSGNQLTNVAFTNTLWSGFGGPCQTNNSGDAIFAYDEQADRYVLTQFAVASGNQSVCWAISQTGDPTGAYYLYEVVTPRFPDYYKVGVWPDPANNAYFFGTNSGQQGQYDVFAVDRANMLNGAPARPMQFFQSFVNLLMPADVDGPAGPPLGSPGIFYTFRDGGEPYFFNPPADSIDVWEFDVDWSSPGNTTFTLVDSLAPTPFNWTVCGFFQSNCLPQPGTTRRIDSASWWPMQRLVYRNFGTHQTLVGSWTVDVLSSGDRAAPRWFELRNNGAGWSVFQEGTYSPDAINRWMPSVAMDGSGNIALGFSRGDGSNFPSIYYATRNATDPLGTMGSEEVLINGSGSQTSTSGRWGDYASMELDPSDDCTFWFTSEYLSSTSNAGWRTRVGTFTVPGCGGPPVPDFNVICTPDVFTIEQGGSDTSTCSVTSVNGFNDSVRLSCSAGNGIACSFNPADVTPPADGSVASTLTLTVPGGQPTGQVNLSVVGTSSGNNRTAAVSVDVVPQGSNGPQDAAYNAGLGAPECGIAGSSCSTQNLVLGRANLGPEPNQPNTLDSCSDGTAGSYLSDESNERIVVSTLDGGNFSEGDTVQIDATVYAWNTGSQDTLDLYYASDANNPNWVFITSIGTPTGGLQTLSAQYTLPAGSRQAVRAQFRYQSSQTPCASGTYNDRDDLVFAVETNTPNTAPAVTISAPANGASFTAGDSVVFSGSASDFEDGNLSVGLAWSSSLDGIIGGGGSFSTSSLSVGVHTITASVSDSGGLSGSDVITITVNDVVNTAPDVTISAPANGSTFTVGTSISFNGSAIDAEDGNLSVGLAWSSSIDGIIGGSGSFSTSSLSIGVHTITASVNDTGGLVGSDVITITVEDVVNTAPSASITAPSSGLMVTLGTPINFAGSATDAEEGNLSSSLSWTSSIDGGIGSGASFTTSALSIGVHTITASVTDSGGLSDSDNITVTVDALPGGDTEIWMSFRSNTAVPGVGTVADEDIVSYNENTGTWALQFDGSDLGLGGLEIDGLAILPDGDLLLSFRDAATVGGVAADDSDVVRFTPSSLGSNTAGTFSLYFDGSDVGLTTNGEDVDGITLNGGSLVISSLNAVTASGISGARDEDLLLFTGTTGSNTSGTFSLLFDGSDVGLGDSGGEDVDAAAFTSTGTLLLSTQNTFNVPGQSGEDEDVAEFTGTFGTSTSGSISIRLDLTALGIAANEDIGSMHIVD